jgi:hypothetical protein
LRQATVDIRCDLLDLRVTPVDSLRQQSDAFRNDPQFMPEIFCHDLEVPARFRMRCGVLPPHRLQQLLQIVVHRS